MQKWLSAVAGAVALACAASSAYAQKFEWHFANGYPPTEFQSEGMQRFADRLRKETDGKLDITVHHNGSLFPIPEVTQAARNGLAQMGSELMSNLSRENPLWGVDGIPFLVTSYDGARNLWSVSREPLAKVLATSGLRLLYAVPWPSQGFFFKKEVKSLADVKGLKMRAYNPMTSRLAQVMGAEPVSVIMTDVPQAFATGLVSSMHTSPSSGVVFAAWEYTSHYLKTDAWLPKLMVYVREDDFKALPSDMQSKVLSAAKDIEEWGWKRSEEIVAEAEKTLADKGMKVHKPNEALAKQLAGIGETMADEWAKTAGPEGKAILEALRAKKPAAN